METEKSNLENKNIEFSWLLTENYEEVLKIRYKVFQEELGIDKDKEIDEFDKINSPTRHLLVKFNKESVATCRILFDEKQNKWYAGRFAVKKEFRKNGFGKILICETLNKCKEMNIKCLHIRAISDIIGFYLKFGFEEVGERYQFAGKLHGDLIKNI